MMGRDLRAPGRGRIRRARKAGHRGRAPYLRTGVVLLGLAALASAGTDGLARWWAARFHFSPPSTSPWAGVGGLDAVVWVVLPFGLVAMSVGVVGAMAGGGVGPRDPGAVARLGLRRVSMPWWVSGILAGVALLGVAWGLGGVAAGAARAVDASPDGLRRLWHIWLVRGATTTGLVLISVGLLERISAARVAHRALYQTPEQRREDDRRTGAR